MIAALVCWAQAVGAAPAGELPRAALAPAASSVQAAAPYTLEQVLDGLRRRESKYRSVPLRIEYTRTVNEAQGQPPQKTRCSLVIHWNNYRDEVRDTKGRSGCYCRSNGVRAEIGRHWEGCEMLLPGDDTDARDLGERIYYLPHNVALPADVNVALLVDGPPAWMLDYFRETDKAGTLSISKAEVSGLACVQLAAGGTVLALAPQYDWAIVRCNDLTAAEFKTFDGLAFPTALTRARTLHDFQGRFWTYREVCEIQKISKTEPPGPEEWKIPEPKPGTWVKVGYPRWNDRWSEPDLGGRPGTARQTVLDCVRFEQAFEWSESVSARDARIYEVSRYWRDGVPIRLALDSEGAHLEGYQAPLPFLSRDGERIVWATFDPTQGLLAPFEEPAQKAVFEGAGLKCEAGFVPEKRGILLGEPIFVTFYVTNTGEQTFYLETGGDSRGVRSDRFQFWAVDAQGHRAPDPYPEPGHFGGLQGAPPKVAPGQGYSEKLYLPLWVKFDRPGEYVVRGRRILQLLKAQTFSRDYALVRPLLGDFALAVRPEDPQRLAERIRELGAQLDAADAASVSGAVRKLADIEDNRVVPHLVRVIEQGQGMVMACAATGLGKHPGPGAVEALAKALQYPGDAWVRSTAATALGNMRSEAAVRALTRALQDADEQVRAAAARPLGETGQAAAVPALKGVLTDSSMTVRLAAVEALQALGEPFHSEWVTPIILSKRPAYQNAIWFVRRHAGANAAALLVDCLETANPSVTNYYNYTLTWQIGACGGPKRTYHHDFQKEGTAAQIEENRQTLLALGQWRSTHPLQ